MLASPSTVLFPGVGFCDSEPLAGVKLRSLQLNQAPFSQSLNRRTNSDWAVPWRAMVGGQGVGFRASRQVTTGSIERASVSTQEPAGVSEASPRRLILLRHAKSSWTDSKLKDHQRPLNKRGRHGAASVAHKLKALGWIPDLILCSDSTRTRETLEIMVEEVHQFGVADTRFLGTFYSVPSTDGHTADHLQETVGHIAGPDVTCVMCMGHNRGWEEAASEFSGQTVELKTANAALLAAVGESWTEAFERAGSGGWKLLTIVTPDPFPDE